MKRCAVVVACVLAMAPGVASAALSVHTVPSAVHLTPGNIPTGEQFFDLVFDETAPTANEGLFAYDLYVVRDKPGINLLRAEKPDNWVFTSPGASFQQSPEFSNSGLLVANAIGDLLGANQDIVSGTKVARVFYTIDPTLGPGAYHISLDNTPGTTLFVSGDTGEAIPVDLSNAVLTIDFIPEPAGLSLIGVAGLLALRRRRRL